MRDTRGSLPGFASSGQSAGDLRVRRSRTALTIAFTELALERGYRGIGPGDVAERADVGRSTLYTHFSGMDDLLAQSLDRHLTTLAYCTLKPEMDSALLNVVQHFWDQRRVARQILQDDKGVAVPRLLISRLEVALVELRRSRRLRSGMPIHLVAVQIAAGQLAVLDAWLAGRASATPDQISLLLQETTYATAIASL